MIYQANNDLNRNKHKILSLVESHEPVPKGSPEGCDTPQSPETSMILLGPLNYVLMSAVTEGGVGRHFTIAELVVA
jgi:hypothetical protein